MKIQQRKFVVERKSGRRRLSAEQGSIWGSADLKALMREAEADAPHLFEPTMPSAAPNLDGELQTETALENLLSDKIEIGAQTPISAPPAETELIIHFQEGIIPNSGVIVTSAEPRARSPRRAKRQFALTSPQNPDGAAIEPTLRPTPAKAQDYADDWVALDEENRRLKGLLAQHLFEQNTHLRKMLARFAVT